MKYNLSEITSLIRNRRSVRPELMSKRKVHREQVELMLTNATWAPTHGMTQPWKFIVFAEKSLHELSVFLPELYRSLTPADKFNQVKYDKMKTRLSHVSCIVAVCMKRDESGKIREVEEVEAVACAVQNLTLTATAYGIASFWSTPAVMYTSEMKEFLGISERDMCLGLVYLGYFDGEWPTSHRRPLEYVTEWRD
ncbi:MAG: hypothetical protein RL220_162 [Bacteroidota bacterium]